MADSDLRRTHPATVAVRTLKTTWQGLIAALGFAVVGAARGGFLAAISVGGFVLLITVLGAGFAWLHWLYFRYGIVGGDLLIAEGWLVRKRRTIPLARVQGVDVRADLFMRMLGVTDIVVQTAGGGAGEPEASIGEVSLAEAERLRFALLHGRRADATEAGQAPVTDSAGKPAVVPVSPLGPDPIGRMSDLRGALGGAEQARLDTSFEYRLTPARLVLTAVTSRSIFVVMAAILVATTQLAEFTGGNLIDTAGAAVAGLGVAAIVAVSFAAIVLTALVSTAVAVSRDFGFVARRVADRVETEAGLLERRMTGMPVRRIQAVSIDEAPLRRWLGWATIDAVTAGFGHGEEKQTTTARAIVPIARRSEIPRLLHGLLPEVEEFPAVGQRSRRALRFYVTVPALASIAIALPLAIGAFLVLPLAGLGAGLTGLLVIASIVGYQVLSWRHCAFGTDAQRAGGGERCARQALGADRPLAHPVTCGAPEPVPAPRGARHGRGSGCLRLLQGALRDPPHRGC